MRNLNFIILFLGINSANAQILKVEKTIISRDISLNARNLFLKQLDTLKRVNDSTLILDSLTFEKFFYGASVFYLKGDLPYGEKQNFGRLGALGCGYHEGDEPHKIIAIQNGIPFKADYIYDFEDSTVYYSSENYQKDKINFTFGKNSPPLTTIIIFPGNQTSETNWKNYSRPKNINVFKNGKLVITLLLDNIISKQVFEFNPIGLNGKSYNLTFVITEVYKGDKLKVAISDIEFDGYILWQFGERTTWGFAIVGQDVRTISSGANPSFYSGRTSNIEH